MSTAKKQNIDPPEESLSDELDFDVENDWRKESDSTSTNLFREDDMEIGEEDMDTSIFSLDTSGEVKKESIKEQSKAQKEAMKAARTKKKADKDATLKALQEAAAGGEGEDVDDLEILTEDDKALVNDPIFTNKGDQYPQIHGNYFLLDHLVDGGMAKVCRARYLGEGDEADKMVAIKMVQEKFSADESFVQMFVDEIKVSFGLNHPNINTTFDYGKIGKNLFVSMEYIHGKDLMVVIDKLKAQKKTIPVPMAIFIASKMAEALHYAHNFTNQLTGQKYNIVHRDISPHNAMISYDGFVKVIDFGIAKADTNTTEEEEGTIKGKINYFAPEYLEGKKIDGRYDQFAVALTLWEMLTGKKTFTGNDQLLTLKTILECNPDLASKYNKKVPKVLDQIIMKALSKDPANRYKDMEAFNKALMKTLYQTYPDFHESDLSKLMKMLFKKDYEKDLEKFKEFGQYSIKDVVAKIDAFKEFQKKQKEKASKSGNKESMFDFGFDENTVSARGKSGLDSLMTKRKKNSKPGSSQKSFQRSRQKTIASMLDDEDSVQTVGSFERNKGKLIFFGILVLAFFQKELILNTLFSDDDIMNAANPVNQVTQQIRKKEKKVRKKEEENREFLKKLQAERRKAAKNAPAPAPVARQAKARPARPKKAAVQNINVSGKNLVDQVLKKKAVENKPRPKPVQPHNNAPISNVNISSKPIVNDVVDRKDGSSQPQNRVIKERAAQKVVAKPKAAPVQDIDDLSFEELKKKMEQQISERKRKAEQRNQQERPQEVTVETSPPASETSAGTGVAPVRQPASAPESPEGSPSTTSGASENLENMMMDKNQAASLENQLNEVKEEYQAEDISLSKSISELKEKLNNQNNPSAPQAGVPSQPTAQPQQPSPPQPELSATDRELKDLKEKMAKLLEEQKQAQEEPSIDKVNINLTENEEKEVAASEEAAEVENPEDIQRDLASRLDELDEEGESDEVSTGEEGSGVVDGVVDFIKTRRAFRWMFND